MHSFTHGCCVCVCVCACCTLHNSSDFLPFMMHYAQEGYPGRRSLPYRNMRKQPVFGELALQCSYIRGKGTLWRWAGPLHLLGLLMELAAGILGQFLGLCTYCRDPILPSDRAVVGSARCEMDLHSSLLSCWPHKHSSTQGASGPRSPNCCSTHGGPVSYAWAPDITWQTNQFDSHATLISW